MEIFISVDRWIVFFIFFDHNFFNRSFNYKMTNLTYSADNNINSQENIKDNILKYLLFIRY